MFVRLNRWLIVFCMVISGTAFVFMTSIAFVDSIGRMLRMPLLGGNEMVRYALLIFFFSSLALVVRDDAHIRVGLLSELYKPRLAWLERWFTGIAEFCCMCFLAYMIYDQADRLARFGTQTPYFQMRIAPWVYFATALAVIAAWFALRNLWIVPRKVEGPRPHAIPDEEK